MRMQTQLEVTSNQTPVTRKKVKIMELLREKRDFAIRFFSGNWLQVSGNCERSERYLVTPERSEGHELVQEKKQEIWKSGTPCLAGRRAGLGYQEIWRSGSRIPG